MDNQNKSPKPKTDKRFLLYYSLALLIFAALLLGVSYLSSRNMQNIENTVSDKVDEGLSALTRLDKLTKENAEYILENNELKMEIEALTDEKAELNDKSAALEADVEALKQRADAFDAYSNVLEAFIKGDYQTAEAKVAQIIDSEYLGADERDILRGISEKIENSGDETAGE